MTDFPLRPEVTRENGWVGVARDSRTGHYWHMRPEVRHLPQCGCCGLFMTDWSLINQCGTDLAGQADRDRYVLARSPESPG